MADGHQTKMTSWITVGLITIASVLLGFALPLESLALAIVGGIVLLAGLVTDTIYRIMDDAH